MVKTVNANTLKKWLENNEAVLVDVRDISEHKAECIAGSTCVHIDEIKKSALPKANGKKYVLHCNGGKRSGEACQMLLQEDKNLEVYSLEGGMKSWISSGYETCKACKFSLDSQMRMFVGGCVLLGTVLGYLDSPVYLFLPAIFGWGLIYSGYTGTCGMLKLISQMPWNKKE